MQNYNVSPQEAAQELLARRQARKGLIDFTRYTFPKFQPGAHHIQIAQALESVERGECDRLMIFAPPRHTKSELASRRFPAWYLGKHPDRQVITTTYAGEFAQDFGRDVREIVQSQEFGRLFEDVTLAADSAARGRWHTNSGGVYFAVGVGGPITGRGAHLALIDDPVKNRQEAESELIREQVWHWYTSTLRTRLMPGGAIVLICCMTGDTPVLMSDWSEKPLRDVRAGDEVMSYECGNLVPQRVLNWVNHGPDNVYEIRTTHATVKANERHPFLVDRDGSNQWIRVRNLRVGDRVVSIGESGAESHASFVKSQRVRSDIATRITTSTNGQVVIGHLRSMLNRAVKRICAIGMELMRQITMPCYSPSMVSAPSAAADWTANASSSALTMIMQRAMSAACYVTDAILRSGTAQPPRGLKAARNISEIISIREVGREDVFDIQVERTENFIANGLVSHNTRWHEDDLAGRLLDRMKHGGEQWKVVSLPAINESGAALWPEWYPLNELERIKSTIGPRDWLSLYQQTPTAESGTYFKRDWFRRYTEAPTSLNCYVTGDFAVSADEGDYTELAVWGVDSTDKVYALDWWAGRKTADVWIDRLLDLVEANKALRFVGEMGPIRRAIEPLLERRMRERGVFVACEWLPTNADKAAQARSFQGLASLGRVYWPQVEWAERVIDQCLRFPGGRFDDAVDACSIFGRFIASTWAARTEPAPVATDWDAPLRIGDFFKKAS